MKRISDKNNIIITTVLLVISEVGIILGLLKIFERPFTEFVLNSFRYCVNAYNKAKDKLYLIMHRKLYTYIDKNGKVKTVWVVESRKERKNH